ncbi:O-methyltransferase [Gudongella sp. DL1XJH-153]|uniref:O-methyltransferase n=1 Tax=Gudongella sp. DL1XJH-153 TaxID=3409804 RepID=UPI003BB80139
MSSVNEDYITSYIRDIVPEKCGQLKMMEDYAHQNNVPIIEPEVGQLISVLLKLHKPKEILEVGTAIGYSALLMAQNLHGNWNITTMEKNPEMIEKALEYFQESPYGDRIRIIEGDARETFPHLTKKYDFIFLDAAKGQYMEFLRFAMDLLEPGGLIVSDNVLYKGMVASDKLVVRRKRTIVNRLREFLEHINNMQGYTSSVLPLGDGVALTFKEDLI